MLRCLARNDDDTCYVRQQTTLLGRMAEFGLWLTERAVMARASAAEAIGKCRIMSVVRRP